GLLAFEKFSGDKPGFGLRPLGKTFRPVSRLLIHVFKTAERATGQEVGLGSPETPLTAGLPIGMPFFMGYPGKAVGLGKGYHFGINNRVLAGAVQHRKVGVVDNAGFSRIPPPAQGLMEEALHAPTVEAPV